MKIAAKTRRKTVRGLSFFIMTGLYILIIFQPAYGAGADAYQIAQATWQFPFAQLSLEPFGSFDHHDNSLMAWDFSGEVRSACNPGVTESLSLTGEGDPDTYFVDPIDAFATADIAGSARSCGVTHLFRLEARLVASGLWQVMYPPCAQAVRYVTSGWLKFTWVDTNVSTTPSELSWGSISKTVCAWWQ